VKVELVRRALAGIGCGERDITKKHYDKILELVESNVGSRYLELAGGFVVRSEYGELVFCRASMNTGQTHVRNETITLAVPGSTRFADYRIDVTIIEVVERDIESIEAAVVQGCDMKGLWRSTEQFDFDKIEMPVTVRRRAAGDRFRPLGLGAEKKVGKFLTAEKVPSVVRDKVLIIGDKEKIIWVYPIRISEKAKVTGETRLILKLQVSDAVNG
jgi:tRNA(Ile)-lysidine synthase